MRARKRVRVSGNPKRSNPKPKRSTHCRTRPCNIEASQKRAEAVRLRLAGKTYEEIAAAVGYANKGNAYAAVKIALEETLTEQADEYRRVNRERLETLLRSVWDLAMEGNTFAVESARKVIADLCRLFGLNMPRQVELTGKDGGPIELTGGVDPSKWTPEERDQAVALYLKSIGK